MKRFFALALAFAMTLALAGCGGASSAPADNTDSSSADSAAESFEPVVWKMGNQHNSTQIATIIDKEIVDEIKEATEGRVTIELYTDSSLGDYTSVFDELMLGTVDMANITGVDTYGGLLNAAMIPYMLTGWEQCNRAYRPWASVPHPSRILTPMRLCRPALWTAWTATALWQPARLSAT